MNVTSSWDEFRSKSQHVPRNKMSPQNKCCVVSICISWTCHSRILRPPWRRRWCGTHVGDITTCFQSIVFSVLSSNCLLPLLPLNPCTVARQGLVSSRSQTCRVGGVLSSFVCHCQTSKASCAVLCKYFKDLTLVTVIF